MEEPAAINGNDDGTLSDNSSVPSFLSKRTRPMKISCPDCDTWWRDKYELKRHRGYKKGQPHLDRCPNPKKRQKLNEDEQKDNE